jgi:hypothetical protein
MSVERLEANVERPTTAYRETASQTNGQATADPSGFVSIFRLTIFRQTCTVSSRGGDWRATIHVFTPIISITYLTEIRFLVLGRA